MRKSEVLEKLWLEEFVSRDANGHSHCGLCGNYGVLTKEGMSTPAGQKLTPIRTYCICPNGRAMKKGKALI